MNSFKNFCLDLIYPPFCLYCEERLPQGFKILCQSCFETLSFTNPEEYCRQCFALKEGGVHCGQCSKKGSPFYRLVCALELIGPATSLQQKLYSFNTSFIAKGLAAFMMLSFIQQKLPWPDCIVSVQSSMINKIFRENPSFLLASAASEILSIPLVKHMAKIEDKKVLLIGERLDSHFFSAGEGLIEACPHYIMGAALFI